MSKAVTETGKARKNRTAMSCDRCKSRKTKCNNPVPGPCDYCQSIGASCQIDAAKRKQRPYYFVSEEEFRSMSKILKHCFPDRSLDLADLRSLEEQLNLSSAEGNDNISSGERTALSPAKSESTHSRTTNEQPTAASQQQNGLVLEEIGSLHEELGCLMKDSRGEYRKCCWCFLLVAIQFRLILQRLRLVGEVPLTALGYIGADSGISFNAAVRYLKPDSLAAKLDRDVIPGMKTTIMPPATSESSPGHPVHPSEIQLPARDLCLEYVTRFFEEVHCLYWLYSSEQFHTRFENTYDRLEPVSASWMCSLYAIFALGSQESLSLSRSFDGRTSFDYLAMAKSLISRVCDEANLDSIRALILVSLALQSHCFSNTAYLHTGTACRIAFSLGLHVDKYTPKQGLVEKEHARRLYYTLYIFEQEVALRGGKPCAIAPYGVSWEPPLPSEQVLHPGNTPSGYLEVSASLTRLTKITCQTLYVEPLSGKTKLLSPKVAAILSSLQQWANSVPPHLSRTTHVAPSHKRSIALLHVRYWSVIILATRPFLLCSVVRKAHLQSSQKKKCYDELSNICLDAAAHSLDVLQILANERLLTSLIPSVFNYVLELVQLFLVAFARERSERYVENVQTCVRVLESMDDVGWTSRARPEVMAQLRECGILFDGVRSEEGTSLREFSAFLAGGENSAEVYDLIFAPEQRDANGLGYESIDLADMDFGDTAASEELYQQLINNGRMPQFVTP